MVSSRHERVCEQQQHQQRNDSFGHPATDVTGTGLSSAPKHSAQRKRNGIRRSGESPRHVAGGRPTAAGGQLQRNSAAAAASTSNHSVSQRLSRRRLVRAAAALPDGHGRGQPASVILAVCRHAAVANVVIDVVRLSGVGFPAIARAGYAQPPPVLPGADAEPAESSSISGIVDDVDFVKIFDASMVSQAG